MTTDIKTKCPTGKENCATCEFSKEDLCDYPHKTVIHKPITPEEKDKLRRDLGITDWHNAFDNFKRRPGTEDMFQAFTEFCSNPYDKPLLIAYGGPGVGKSHLLDALVIEWVSKGIPAGIRQFVDVLDALKNAMNNKDEPWRYGELVKRWCNKVKFVLWDDVGMGSKWSEWESSFLEQVVVIRLKERLPTLLITNMDITNLPERVVSRARDKTLARLVLNKATDYRPQKQVAISHD